MQENQVSKKRFQLTDRDIVCCSLDRISILISQGGDINSRDAGGHTMLWWAVFYGNYQLTKYLLDNGANQFIASNMGISPLAIAVDRHSHGYYALDGLPDPTPIIKLLEQDDNWHEETFLELSVGAKLTKFRLNSRVNPIEEETLRVSKKHQICTIL